MIWSGFILGLLSSLHCFGMCGPLQAVVIGGMHKKGKHLGLITYHLSRILTYSLLGVLAGWLGKGLGLQNWQQQTSLITGLLLLFALMAFYFLKLDRRLLNIMYPTINSMRRHIQQSSTNRLMYYGGSGIINGILPCGMVYLALFPAMSATSVGGSATYMALFGIGTLPLLLLGNFGALSLLQKRSLWIQRLIPIMLIATAILLILRGMNLGIPYISPTLPGDGASTEICLPTS